MTNGCPGKDTKRFLKFRNSGQTETELKNKIQALFDEAKTKWEGVFSSDSKIMLNPSHLSICISSLQKVKLFNSNLEVIDEAFEYLINKSSKGEKGQYFTARYVIDMWVKMLNPKENEFMIDTASGSSGFTVHTMFYVWRNILEKHGIKNKDIFTVDNKPYPCAEYVQEKIFSIDFDEKAVRVARTLNLIAGDGQSNVLHLNTLDYDRWNETAKDELWNDTYNDGFKKLKKLAKNKDSYKEFCFDILMANPPFAGDIKDARMLRRYELAHKSNVQPDKKQSKDKGWSEKVSRDILFLERNLDFLKPGGRMAIVLPQGRFNNVSDKYIRDFIAKHCRILAVVGLHSNTFKPHTGTKTSVLFVQKWDDTLCPKKEDYNIFFATMRKSGKDNSGEKIYVKQDNVSHLQNVKHLVQLGEASSLRPSDDRLSVQAQTEAADIVQHYQTTPKEIAPYLLDSHGHLIVDHDLYNHDGLTQDGIAEAFAEFAKKEGLSFF